MIFKVLIFLFSIQLYSDSTKFIYYLEWTSQINSKGYFIELRDSNLKLIQREQVKTNYFEFNLKVGTYQYRIASENKFGKPSSFSEWEEFKVDKHSSRIAIQSSEEKKRTIPKWNYFIPGMTQYKANQKIKSYLWIFWFSSLAFGGNYYRIQGNKIANDPFNDPIYLTLINLNTPILVDLIFLSKWNENISDYNRFQDNQKRIGVVAFISYILQIYNAKKSNDFLLQVNIVKEKSISDIPIENAELFLTWRF